MNKLSIGFCSGLLAGLIKSTIDLTAYYGVGFIHNRYLDHVAGDLLGHPAETTTETFFFFLVEVWIAGVFGILYIFLSPSFHDSPYLLRGFIYGSVLWFLLHSLGSVFRLPTFEHMLLAALILHLVADILYGMGLAYLIRIWTK